MFDQSLILQSHRGAGNLMPENTLEAFELAWQIGAIPEADVRATRDGVIVAFHDENFDRLAPAAEPDIRSNGIHELDWSVVSRLDVGAYMGPEFEGQCVPCISEVLDRMSGNPERRIYLDVKEVSLGAMAAMVRERRLDAQVILASTRYEELREWMLLLPRSATLLWLGGTEVILRERIASLRETEFTDITQLQIHVHLNDPGGLQSYSPSPSFMRGLGREMRARGILFQALVWGAASPEVYRELMDLGVESFATDQPLDTLALMRAYRQGK